MYRRLKIFTIMLLTSLYLIGFAAPEQQKVELNFLTIQLYPKFKDYINGLIQDFEQQHPQVKIKWLDYPIQGYETKLLTDFRSKNPPDIMNLNYFYGLRFWKKGLLVDLKELVPPEVLNGYFPRILTKACSYKGAVFALPWYLASDVTMYNEKILRDAGLDPNNPPTTYDELAEYGRIIKKRTGKFGFFTPLTEEGTLKGLMVEDGIPLVNEEMNKVLFYPQGVATLKFWSGLYREGIIPRESLMATHPRAIELYKTEKTAFFVSGPQFLSRIKGDVPELYQRTRVAPRVKGKGGTISVEPMNIAVARQCQHPKLAAEFAAFVTNAKNQLAFCKIVTIFPSVVAAAQDDYFQKVEDTPEGKARLIGARQLGDADILIPPLPHMQELNQAINEAMEKACLGMLSPDEALKAAAQRWNEILKQ